MASQKLSAITTITTPASGDKLYILDISDTTDGADGSSRAITYTNLVAGITGFAASGANSDITSLTGLTTPLSVAQGGTGAATLTGILKGNGTSAVTAVTAPSGAIVGDTDTQTLSGKTLTAPKLADGGFIADANGNELIKGATTASAVNEVTVSNAATGNNPVIEATGGDSTIAVQYKGKSAFNMHTGEYDAGNSSTAITINWKNGDRQKVTMTGNCTFTFSNAVAGQTLTLRAVQDATGGRTHTFPTLKWPGGTVGTPGTGASDINLYIFYFDGTNYLAQLAADFS